MTPSPFDPNAILSDTIQQSENRLSSAGWFMLLILAGVGLVAFGRRGKR